MRIEIDLIFDDYKDLSLIDSNNKFKVIINDKKVIIEAKDYSSLRAGVNAILKELIILEKIEKEIK
jgi:tRNA threonylcarbamoyladenosine modification (KEOPS) complex  Pcc1 subunit